MFHYIHTFIMLNVNFGKHIWIHTSKIKKKHAHFKISSRDEVFIRLFFFFSFLDEISSRQKRVNSKRHFTIDRDDFVPGWNFTCKHPLKIIYSPEINRLLTFECPWCDANISVKLQKLFTISVRQVKLHFMY